MAADLSQLTPDLRSKVETLLQLCAGLGVEMRPSSGLRDPFDQARLWRQSRSIEQINLKVAEFRAAGAHFLAHCITSVGPQQGDPVTNAPPGFSWHQWGEAVDCFWLVDGKAEWSVERRIKGRNGYRVYSEQARQVGLTSGGQWTAIKDWPHVQLRAAASPDRILSVVDIDRAMEATFEG